MEVLIRQAKRGDFVELAAVFDHPQVVENSSQRPFLGSERVQKIFEDLGDDSILLVAEVDGKVVGHISININPKLREKHVANLGMAVHPDYQRRGVGSRLLHESINLVDNWLNIIRFELDVYTDNDVAINLYKKFGFEIEGEFKYASFKNGSYINLYKMARIRPDFQ